MLKDRTRNLRTQDDSNNMWVSCGQRFMAMHESNPTSQRLKPKILKG
jgi:hypothetical protein